MTAACCWCTATTVGGPVRTTVATQQMAAMCVHEHLMSGPVCDAHMAQCAAEAERGLLVCAECRHSTEPHFCRIGMLAPTPL